MISRHNYEVPKSLREDASDKFPRYHYFQSNIETFLPEIRGPRKIDDAETKLIEWLFQIAENAHEHGSVYQNVEYSIKGYRGILLRKLIIRENEDIDKRSDIPGFIRAFIQKSIAKRRGIGKSSDCLFNIATVIDLGQGIQKTLPKNIIEGVSSFDALQLAFKDGITRKSTKIEEKSGYGLGQAVNAAVHLGAFIHVVSGECDAVLDLSIKNNWPVNRKGEVILHNRAQLSKQAGTSISLIWLTKS